MTWVLLLGAVVAALVWLGRRGGRAGGDWRVAGSVLAAAAGLGAATAAARGVWPFAAVLAVLAAFLLTVGRRKGLSPDALSDAEARALLGVGPDATVEEIRSAHRALIRAAHPDRGGASDRAARLNAARDRLLRARRG